MTDSDSRPAVAPAREYHAHKTVPVQVWADVDVGIADAVRYLNTLDGVRTDASCQGTLGEGGAEPYAPYVMAHWPAHQTELLEKRFHIELLGTNWGYLRPRSPRFVGTAPAPSAPAERPDSGTLTTTADAGIEVVNLQRTAPVCMKCGQPFTAERPEVLFGDEAAGYWKPRRYSAHRECIPADRFAPTPNVGATGSSLGAPSRLSEQEADALIAEAVDAVEDCTVERRAGDTGLYRQTLARRENATAAPPASAPPREYGCLLCGSRTIANGALYHAPGCSGSAPAEHAHTCTDPGPLLARIEELESALASRDAEIARLLNIAKRAADWIARDPHTPGCGYNTFGSCSCESVAILIELRALAAPPDTTTETPHG